MPRDVPVLAVRHYDPEYLVAVRAYRRVHAQFETAHALRHRHFEPGRKFRSEIIRTNRRAVQRLAESKPLRGLLTDH
jgi:hypothetical protein